MKASKTVDDISIPLEVEKKDQPQFCFIVFSSHAKHIEITIDCIENVIEKEDYTVKRLDKSLKSEDSQYMELTDLLKSCSFAVVILDGLRPNVLLEYGILKGIGKPCIVLLEEKAEVNLASFFPEDDKPEKFNLRIDMDRHVSDIKDRFYVKYNKNRPKEIRDKIRKEYFKLKKDIDAENIRMLIPNIEIVDKELKNQFKVISTFAKKKKEQLNAKDEIEFKMAIRKIQDISEEYGLKLPKHYYYIICRIFVNFRKIEDALRLVNSVIEEKKEDIDLIIMKSICLAELERFKEAIETIDTGIKLFYNMESLWHIKGMILERIDRKDEALLCYKKGIQFDDTCPDINFLCGVLLYEKKEFDSALVHFERALEIKPTKDVFLIWKSKALQKLDNKKEAKKVIEEAICFNEDNADVWFTLGKITADRKESIKYFDKALLIDPQHEGALCSKAAKLSNIGKYSQALDIFTKMSEFCSKSESCITLLCNMGKTLSKNEQYEEALSYLERALKIDEDNTEAIYLKATILVNIEKEEQINIEKINKSLKLFKRVLELDPEKADAWYNQSCAFAILNKVDESIESLKKAIELDPSYKNDIKTDQDFEKIRNNEKFKREFE